MKNLILTLVIVLVSNLSLFAQSYVEISLVTIPKGLREYIKIDNKNAYLNIPSNIKLFSSNESPQVKELQGYFENLSESVRGDYKPSEAELIEFKKKIKEQSNNPYVIKVEQLLDKSSSSRDFLNKLSKDIELSTNVEEKNFLLMYSYSYQIIMEETKNSNPETIKLMNSGAWKCLGRTLAEGCGLGFAGAGVMAPIAPVGWLIGYSVGAFHGLTSDDCASIW